MTNLDDELNAFSTLSNQILKQLSSAIDLVKKGIAPTIDDAHRLGIDMSQLQKTYDHIRSYAHKTVGSDQPLADNLPAAQYIALAKAAAARERIADVLALLDRFCQITSDTPKLVDALRPFQDQAAKSASSLRRDDAHPTTEDLDKISKPKKLLVDAIDAIDADGIAPEDTFSLLLRLNEAYPQDVAFGVASRLYYFGKKPVTTGHSEKSTTADEKPTPSATTPTKPAAPAPAPARPSIPETLQALEYKRRTGFPNSSAIKADIVRLGDGLALAFPAIAKFGAITTEQLDSIARLVSTSFDPPKHLTTQQQLARGLAFLVDSGIASKYSLDGQVVYCLTSFGRNKFASNDKVRNLKLDSSHPAWVLFITPNQIRADSSVPESKLRSAVELTQLAIDYMDSIWDHLSHAKRRLLLHNIRCDGTSLMAHAIVHGKFSKHPSFHIVRHTADVPKGATDIIALDQLDVQEDYEESLENEQVDWPEKDKPAEKSALHTPTKQHVASKSKLTPTDEDSKATTQEPATEPTSDAAPNTNVAETVAEIVQTDGNSEISAKESPAESVPNQASTSAAAEVEAESVPKSRLYAEKSSAPDSNSPVSRAARFIAAQDTPTDEELATLAWDMVRTVDTAYLVSADSATDSVSSLLSPVATALTLLESASQIRDYNACRQLFNALVTATDSKIAPHEYTGAYLSVQLDLGKVDASLVLAAYLRAMLAPTGNYEDWILHGTCETYFDEYDQLFGSYQLYKPLFNDLKRVWDCSRVEGFSDAVLDLLSDDAEMRTHLRQMVDEARAMLATPRFKSIMAGLPEFAQLCFGRDSNLGQCMQIIANNDVGEKELVRSVLQDYGKQDAGAWQIDQDVIDQLIDDNWHTASSGKTTGRLRKLGLLARKQANEYFVSRLNLMQRWVSYDDSQIDVSELDKLRSLRSHILSDIDEILGSGADFTGQAVLVLCLRGIKARLTSGSAELTFYDLLRSGYISLDQASCPVIDQRLNSVRYAEPWREALRHYCDWCADALPTLMQAGERILASDTPTSDNLGQLRSITALLASAGETVPKKFAEAVSADAVSKAQNRADLASDEFDDYLEIAYAYGRIDEAQKEILSEWASSLKEAFYQRDDYGCWQRLLQALRKQVDDDSRDLGRQLTDELKQRRARLKPGKTSSLLDEADKLLAEEQNFAVVEEYINRFDLGERDVVGDLGRNWREDNDFEKFISDDVFDKLYSYCYGHRYMEFRKFAVKYVRNNHPSDWTAHYRESAENLVRNWPIHSLKNPPLDEVTQLMRELGFNSVGCKQLTKGVEHFVVDVKPEPTGRKSYAHPIKDFGTKMADKLDVIVLRGSLKAPSIIQKVDDCKTRRIPVVLLDSSLSLGERRQLAELLHSQRSRLSQFLLVDHVLALHLALHVKEERLPLLLKCTLPFTYYQPFVRDGGATSDEMFVGRETELASILNPDGACVVYGGRQLGKTALLERAANLANKPSAKEYAVYVSILSCDTEEDMATQVSDAIAREVGLYFGSQSSISALANRIETLMRDRSINRLLLLLDESDRFLESISADSYEQLQPLVDLKRKTGNDFKFVLAGLHNVSRAQKATANNGIFGQLGEPLCVMPLSPNDALSLISRPLGYLGFQVAKYPHLETILTNTNYYPGIIQFFGYELVDTMTNQYGIYYSANKNNPPYTLEKKQLGDILNRTDMNNSIKEKFRLSLDLDPRYLMIARCISVLYFENRDSGNAIRNQEGYSASDVMNLAADWELSSFADETEHSLNNLLDEMVDMGILFRTDNDRKRYRMRRRSFINIIGKNEDNILTDMLQAEEPTETMTVEKDAKE